MGSRLIYPATPEYFGDFARRFLQAGASIIGGCCGTTPDHIRAMRAALDEVELQRSITVEVHDVIAEAAEDRSGVSSDADRADAAGRETRHRTSSSPPSKSIRRAGTAPIASSKWRAN